jgi:hypothetical protein
MSPAPGALPPAASCGQGMIDGGVWRPGDPVKHLGPPYAMVACQSSAFYASRLFSTRCGLGPRYEDGTPMGWQQLEHDGFREDDDYWCPACLARAGIAYELVTDDGQEPGGGGDEQPGT